ncbi:MAG TPA: antifreeze protein [Paenirhodobacter sp.]
MFYDPFSPFKIALQATRIGIEAQAVVTMRLAGMAGLWDTPSSEMTRMVVEKAEAVTQAMRASTQAAIRGAAPDQVLQAGMAQIGQYTTRNLARLSQMGPARW